MGKLTVRGIENAKAKDKPYKLMDGDGLQLRVATDGDKTWLVRYAIQGVERQYRLPRKYRDTSGAGHCSLQDAREEASKIRTLPPQPQLHWQGSQIPTRDRMEILQPCSQCPNGVVTRRTEDERSQLILVANDHVQASVRLMPLVPCAKIVAA